MPWVVHQSGHWRIIALTWNADDDEDDDDDDENMWYLTVVAAYWWNIHIIIDAYSVEFPRKLTHFLNFWN